MDQDSVATLTPADDAAVSVDETLMRGISRFVVAATVLGVVAAVLLSASRRFCDEAHCYVAQLGPSPWLYAGVAAIVILTLGFVREAGTRERAVVILGRATTVVGVAYAVAVIVSQVWLYTLPMQDFATSGINVVPPFVFSTVRVETLLVG